MKILKLTFKNINNLKGKHIISFDKTPLSTAGIFAITGPTGSGKSTILDVVTLALFNKIPRFKNASNKEVVISKKQIQEHGSIMTLHTDESYAAIEYEINNLKYTSEWTLAKARTGNLKDYEMHIYDALGSPLDLKKSEVPAKNEEIIGLSYAQFVKSIILSQGEFSKFLKADKNERGRLLENITGTSIYRKIGKASFEKEKEAREAIEKAREVIGVIEVLSDDDIASNKEQTAVFKKEKKGIDTELKGLYDILKIKDEVKSKSQILALKKQDATTLKQQQLELTPFLEKLSIHEKLNPVQGKLAIYNDAIINRIKTNENIATYKTSHEESSIKLKKAINEMAELTKSKVELSNFKKVMSTFEKEINDLDRDLKELKIKGGEERTRINNKSKNYPITLSNQPEEASQQLQNRLKTIIAVLSDTKMELNSKIPELKKQLKTQRETVVLFQSIYRENDLLAEVKIKIEKNTRLIKQYITKETELLPKLKSAQEVCNLLKEKIQLLEKQKSDALRIESLEETRSQLEEGSPCPLCGAIHHPYSAHAPNNTTSKIEKSIQETKEKLSHKEVTTTDIEKLRAETSATISLTKEQTKALEAQHAQLGKNITTLLQQNQHPDQFDLNNLSELLKKARTQENNIEESINVLEEYAINKELQELYKSLSSLMTTYKSKNSQRQSKYQGHDISTLCNILQDRFEVSKTSIERLNVSIEKEGLDLKRATDLVENIDKELTPQLAKLGFSSLAEAGKNFLPEDVVKKIRSKKEALSKLLTTNETEISNLEKELESLSKKDSKASAETDQIKTKVTVLEKDRDELSEQIGQLEAIFKRDQEDRLKIKEKEKQIEGLERDYKKWSLMKKLIGDANGNTFANFAQGLTLQNLLVYANRRLEKLSDRYLLDMPKQEDVLNVVDQYQGNISRAVTTLSGGESFLISLALALSLSDMASKNIALDSLFIDEGFGTLDQETLDIAINTLEKLQSESQKTVGVISHVAALKERINVQIVLNKNAQGYSEIEVRS